MKKILIAILLLFSAMCFAHTDIKVIKVYDGDSVLAQIDDNIFRIRLTGIDCYEGTQSERAKWQAKKLGKSLDEIIAGGNLAGEILLEKLKDKKVSFEFQGIDKYDRALGVLYVDKKNINREMLKTPYCEVYKK